MVISHWRDSYIIELFNKLYTFDQFVKEFIYLPFQDREIDAFELQQILSTATKKGIHVTTFATP